MSAALPYDLRIGVTGHRQLAEPKAIEQAVERVVAYIARTLNRPDVAPLKWTVVSPLARGADRIVARVVLTRSEAALQVVTPLGLDDYRQDFTESEDREEFERLLARAASVHQPAPASAASVRGADRDEAYLSAGDRVVDSCELLICVWDGKRANGRGGTEEVVRYALQRDRTVIWINPEQPNEPATLLTSVTVADGQDDPRKETTPLPGEARALSRGYDQQVSYTSDLRTSLASLNEQLRVEARLLENAGAGLPKACVDAVVGHLAEPFVAADHLAIQYQRRYLRATNAVLYLAAAAVTIAVGQVLFFPLHNWVILFEVVAMLAVFAIWWYSRRRAWREKWLHYRYLAEQLRGTVFLTLLGIPRRDTERSDSLPFYPGPHQWMAFAANWYADRAAAALEVNPVPRLEQEVLTRWLLDQQTHHARNAHHKHDRGRRRGVLGYVLFGFTLLMATLHMFHVGDAAHAEPVPPYLSPHVWITFFALIVPAWAGATHAATEQLELHRIAARSKRMERVLGWLIRRAERARTAPELRAIALEATDVMSTETREWWALLSFQDVKLHV